MTTLPGDPFRLIGTTLADKYRVDRTLGEGGFGVVYAGFHLLIQQPVAIKVMKPSGGTAAEQQRVTELFLREARVLFALTHPGIVRMYDLATLPMEGPVPSGAWAPSVPYVVLEYIEGSSLQDEIRRRRDRGGPAFARQEVASIMTQALDAVAFAHEQGVTHRDIKPSNVMLVGGVGNGTAKVVDFGIASVASSAETTTGAPFTPIYAAPEQWDATLGRAGPATDIFALGLLLIEVCTLNKALPYDSLAQVVGAVMDPSKRPSIAAVRTDLPGLDTVVAMATQVRPENRYPSVRAMKEHMLATLGGLAMHGTQPILQAVPSVAPPYAIPSSPPVPQTMMHTGPTAPAVSLGATMPSATQAAPRGSVGKIVLAVTGILSITVLLALTIVGVFAYKTCVDQPWLQPATPPMAENAPAPGTTPTAPLRKLNGWLYLAGANGAPFWSAQQVRSTVDPAVRDFEICYEEHVPVSKRFDGSIYLTISPATNGVIEDVMCSVIVDGKNKESEVCGCLERAAGSLRFPPPTGRLGLLRTGPITITLKTRKKAEGR